MTIFSSMILKLGMEHYVLKLYKVKVIGFQSLTFLDKKGLQKVNILQQVSWKSAYLLKSYRDLKILIEWIQNKAVSSKRGCEGLTSYPSYYKKWNNSLSNAK